MTTDHGYTPTTDQVCLAYIDRADFLAQVRAYEYCSADDEKYKAEFYRWLKQVQAEALEEAPGVKTYDGQQRYHAYIHGPQQDLKLLASGPKSWVEERAREWLFDHEPDPQTQLVISRVEMNSDAVDFITKGAS